MNFKRKDLKEKISKFIVALVIPLAIMSQPLTASAFNVIGGDEGGDIPITEPVNPGPVDEPAPITPITPPAITSDKTDDNPPTGDSTSVIIVLAMVAGGALVVTSKKLKEKTTN